MVVVSKTHLLQRLLDFAEPFVLYYCIRETDRNELQVAHAEPMPWHLFYVPSRGTIEATVEGENVVVAPGQVLWVQPDAVFRLKGLLEGGQRVFSVCRFHLRDSDPYRLAESFCVGNVRYGEAPFDELLPGHEIGRGAEGLRVRAVLARFIANSFFSSTVAAPEQRGGGLSTHAQDQAIQYLSQHITERIVVADVARHVRLNPDYFSRQFKQSFGVPPQVWIKRLRIRTAADHLLASAANISEISRAFSYSSVYFFSRQFREVMGQSPRVWRSRQAAQP